MGGAWAEDPIAAGTTDVGLGGAISVSHGTRAGHETRDDYDTVTGLQLLPHVGYIVSDAMGPGWLRGNLEVLIEPRLLYLKEEAQSATIGGASGLVRWIFSGTRRLRPYLEAGAGVLVGETHFRQTDCAVNFLLGWSRAPRLPVRHDGLDRRIPV